MNINGLSGLESANILPALSGERSSANLKPKSAVTTKRRIEQQSSPTRDIPTYLASTFQQQQRVRNINVPENALNMDFEVRLKELHQTKDSTLRLNAKVIETWINETLKDAEHLDIPGVVLKPEHKNPNSGVPSDQVDRIYRGLFVYSIGFYEMLQRCLHHSQSKYIMLSNLWRVFAILLEYCCKSNYQMLISKLNEEHKEMIEQIEKDFTEHIQKMNESEKNLKDALDDLQKKKDELEKQKEEEEFLRKKIEEEFSKKVETHEEEVQLRLKFEQKLNNMHALHRDLQAKYQRALEDIYNFENDNVQLSTLAGEQKTELIQLRSDKVENESKILYQSERIKQLLQENDLKFRQANELELKLNKAHTEIESKNLDIKNFEKMMNDQRIKIDANQALIDGLTSEKNHLDLSLKESQDQRIQYKEKSERLQKLNEEIFNEMQEYKMQLVGVQEIKKDRDDRLEKLRTELEDITAKFEILDREHTALRVNHEHITEEYSALKTDYESVSERLQLSNKIRNEKEDLLINKTKDYNALQQSHQEKELTIEKLKKEIDKLNRRLADTEMQNDQLDIKKRSVDKQSEIQRRQLLEKISNLNEVITQEKDNREVWIARFDKEQKSHIATGNELLQAKGSMQDAQLKARNLEIVVESLNKQKDLLKQNNNDLQRQVTELITDKEAAERELYSKSELLRVVEEQYILYTKKQQSEHKEYVQHKEWEIQGLLMHFEDLRTRTAFLFEESNINRANYIQHREMLMESQDQKAKLQTQFQDLTTSYQQLSQRYSETCETLRDSEEKNVKYIEIMRDQSIQIDTYEQNITDLTEKVKEMDSIKELNAQLNEKCKILLGSVEAEGDGAVVKGDKTFTNRGIQVKEAKQKEREIQTDPIQQQMSFNNTIQQNQPIYSTTQASSIVHSSQSQKRPRIASAANTQATMAFSAASQMMLRDQSNGGPNSSQGDFNISEQNIPIGALHKASASNFSQEFDRTGLKSAVNKYKHVIPGGNEAIEEEQEQYYGSGQPVMSGSSENDFQQQQIQYPTLQRKHTLGQPPQYNSGIQQQPTGLKNHQIASRQIGSFYNNAGDYISNGVSESYPEQLETLKKPSTQLSKKEDSFVGDPIALNNNALKSVYEKRITQGGIIQTTRPMTQSNQLPQQLAGQNQMKYQEQYLIQQLQYQQNQLQGQPVRIITPVEQQMRADLNSFQKQMSQMKASSSKQGFGPTGKERPVTGKTSIRTLIKVATARD